MTRYALRKTVAFQRSNMVMLTDPMSEPRETVAQEEGSVLTRVVLTIDGQSNLAACVGGGYSAS